LKRIQLSGGTVLLRKTIAFGAIVMLSAGIASVPASATTTKASVVVTTAKTSASSVAAAKARAVALAKARLAASAPKANAQCTKSLTTTKIGKYQYICTKNSHKKYVWTKLSSECVGLLNAYTKMNSDYASALAQVADMEAKVSVTKIPGPSGDALRNQVAGLKSTILILGPTVTDSLAQFQLFCS
jgi:hypothetical protein